MAAGKYHIQILFPGNKDWKTDLRMQGMGQAFAKGAFFALKGLGGGGYKHRLVKCDVPPNFFTKDEDIEVLDEHSTGNISI